jgi:cytidylate kinase
MSDQLIISVSREFGSGGHVIAEKLAEKFGLPVYDRNLLREIALEKDVDAENLEKYDEIPKKYFFSRKVNGYSNSPEENIANMQFDFLRRKADEGESFVVVGRCAESVLTDYDCMIPIFVLADMDWRIQRTMEVDLLSAKDAESKILRYDRKRKEYHNYYCSGKWGDSRNYDITINSGRLGIEKTAELLETYIQEKINAKKSS